MNFGMIILNQNISKIQTYVIWIHNIFIVNIKTKDFYEDINDVEKRFDTSNYEIKRLLPIRRD